jgi:thiamine transporter ThiT
MNNNIKKLTSAGICLALCLVLPFFIGQIPQLGMALSPMHIPVLLAGFICGWPYGLIVGFVAPLLRSVLFGMPALFPNAVAMSFELAAYGFSAGILYRLLPKKTYHIYTALIISMLTGRIIWGITNFILAFLFGIEFSFNMFLSGAFITAIPGIIFHIIIIPVIVIAMKKAGLIYNE